MPVVIMTVGATGLTATTGSNTAVNNERSRDYFLFGEHVFENFHGGKNGSFFACDSNERIGSVMEDKLVRVTWRTWGRLLVPRSLDIFWVLAIVFVRDCPSIRRQRLVL